jgi:hypothetical protein
MINLPSQGGQAAAPLDHPYPGRPHRVYFALTNHCNRSCPWCSTCSSPAGRTFLPVEKFLPCLPADGPVEIQLEGGEPTAHPQFRQFVRLARGLDRLTRLVVCTNGVLLPREEPSLRTWLAVLGEPCTLKLSYNHHLRKHDAGLLGLAGLVRSIFRELAGDRLLVLNVRLRPGRPQEEALIRQEVQQAGLWDCANIFHLQRYGLAASQSDWQAPFLAGQNFRLVNPDGRIFGTDLIARSEAMRELP